MKETIFGHPVWGGMIPIIVGIVLLLLSKAAHRIQLKFWRNWRKTGDKVSLKALGIFMLSLGVIDLIDIFLGIPSLAFWFAPIVLIVMLIFFILKKSSKKLASWWMNHKQLIIFIYHFPLTIAILLLLRWPWALYESGVEWILPNIFKSIFSLSYIIGIITLLILLAKLLLTEIVQIFQAKIRK